MMTQKANLPVKKEIELPDIMGGKSIQELEVIASQYPQVKINTIHHLFPGLYIRETTLKGGCFAVGAYQKTKHLNIMLTGSVTIFKEDGTYQYLKAPMMFMGEPGNKAGVIHEDCTWQNIYPNPDNETDISVLEARFIEVSDFIKGVRKGWDAAVDVETDNDFEEFLKEIGWTDEQVHEDMRKVPVHPMPFGSYPITMADSRIHGVGIFATDDISDDVMLPAFIGGKKTIVGRYTNHSKNPNCTPVKLNGDIYFRTNRSIASGVGGWHGEELTVNYREVVLCRQYLCF